MVMRPITALKIAPPLSKDSLASIAHLLTPIDQQSAYFSVNLAFLGFFRSMNIFSMRC